MFESLALEQKKAIAVVCAAVLLLDGEKERPNKPRVGQEVLPRDPKTESTWATTWANGDDGQASLFLETARRRSRRNRLLLQLVEIDGALDNSYNAVDAARDFDRMKWNSRVFNEMNSTSPFAFMLTVSRIDRPRRWLLSEDRRV